MKKIGNRPITEADTDFSKLQKNKRKKKIRKIFGKFSGFFSPFFTTFSFFSYKEACDYFFYFVNLMNSMFIKHIKISDALILIDVVTEQK